MRGEVYGGAKGKGKKAQPEQQAPSKRKKAPGIMGMHTFLEAQGLA